MGGIHIFAHSRNRGVIYLHNAAPEALKRNYYIMSKNYDLKW